MIILIATGFISKEKGLHERHFSGVSMVHVQSWFIRDDSLFFHNNIIHKTACI